MVVLDNDHLSFLEWADGALSRRLQARLSAIVSDEAATTIVNFEEQMRGWMAYLSRARSLGAQVQAYRRLKQHLDNYRAIPVLEFDDRAAVEFQRLKRLRPRLGAMDLKIAAIVLAHDAILLSRNLTDFRQVPGLRVEDWST